METFSLTFVIVLRCLDDHCQIIIYETKYQKLIEKETFLLKKKEILIQSYRNNGHFYCRVSGT